MPEVTECKRVLGITSGQGKNNGRSDENGSIRGKTGETGELVVMWTRSP